MSQYKYKNKKKQKKFKIRWVVLAILVILIIIGGTVIAKNWDNLQAGYTGLTSDPEKIKEEQARKKADLEQELGVGDGFSEEEMTEATEAVKSLLAGGTLDDVLFGENAFVPQAIAGTNTGSGNGSSASNGTAANGSSSGTGSADGSTDQNSSGSTGTSGSTGSTSTTTTTTEGGTSGTSSSGGNSSSGNNGSSGSTATGNDNSGSGTANSADAISRKYTSQLYALEGVMQAKLNSIASDLKSQYAALPAEERTASKRSALVSSKLDEAEAIESQCDAAVDSILSNMESELKAAGQDTSSVAQLREYYESEKASQKASAIAAMRSAG